jgi:uncharacterized protein
MRQRWSALLFLHWRVPVEVNLPYEHAAMRAVRTAGHVHYECRRKPPVLPEAVFEYETAGDDALPAPEGSLEWFLVERYLLFSADRHRRLHRGRVQHAPYRISPACCAEWSAEPLRWDGFPMPSEAPDSALVARTVDVRVFPLAAADGVKDGISP